MRNKELHIALCLSLAAHGAALCIGHPRVMDISDHEGQDPDIVVLGFARLSSAAGGEAAPESVKEEPLDREEIEENPSPEADMKIATSRAASEQQPAQRLAVPEESVVEDIVPDAHEEDPGKTRVTAGRVRDIQADYLREVMRRLEHAKRYPGLARRRQVEGTVEIEFMIMADGAVRGVAARRSSGHNILDEAAEDMVTRASPFDPIPEELGMPRIIVSAPVSFIIH